MNISLDNSNHGPEGYRNFFLSVMFICTILRQ